MATDSKIRGKMYQYPHIILIYCEKLSIKSQNTKIFCQIVEARSILIVYV